MNASGLVRLGLGVVWLLAAAQPARAAPEMTVSHTVTSLADAGPGSLREAMEQANASAEEDEIGFAVDGAIALLTPLPEIAGQARIDAAGRSITLDGAGIGDEMAAAMLSVPAGARLELNGLALSGARFGALANRGETSLSNCTFSGNENPGNGGAIFNAGRLAVEACTFRHNRGDTGGAIYNDGTLMLRQAHFESNTAQWDGGAIYSRGALDGEQVEFVGNEALEDFGGAVVSAGTARFARSSFSGNSVHNGGGGVYNAGRLTLELVIFTNNGAKWGGALLNETAATLEMTGGGFDGNNAGGHFGGAVDNYGSASLNDVLFQGNGAVERGGGLSNWHAASLANVVFEENRAASGGAVYNWEGAVLRIEAGCVLRGNTAGQEGGAISNGGEAQLTGSRLVRNAAEEGGAIANRGSLGAAYTTLQDNTATGAGGAIANRGSLALTYSTLYINFAGGPGGGLANYGAAGIRNSTFSFNQAATGGGIYNAAGLHAAYVTLAHNIAQASATAGAGLANEAGGQLEIAASIVAAGAYGVNCSGLRPSGLFNISDDATCPAGFDVADLRLGALEDNGGATQTHMLLPGSPAIDRDPSEECGAPDDQRGMPRRLGPGCDSGAVEFGQYSMYIDILPKTPLNRIYPERTRHISVEVISGHRLDAPHDLVWSTLTFGKTGWEKSLYYTSRGKPACGAVDLNGDQMPDLVCSFVMADTGLACGDMRGILRGQALWGEWMVGTEAVTVVCR